jgi:hypothetical protein
VRFSATVLLGVITTVAAAVAVPTAWAQLNLVDADGYAAMARRAASDPMLQSAAAAELADQATALITARGRSVDPAVVGSAAAGYTASPAFPGQFAQVNRLAHGWVLSSDSSGGPWVVDVGPMLADPSLQQMLSRSHVRTPTTLVVPLTAAPPKALASARLRFFASWNLLVCLTTAALAGFSAVLALASARSRAKALTGFGVAALVVGACGWAALEVARRRVDAALDDTTGDIRAIADVMVGHAEDSLHHWLNLTLAAGGVLAAVGVLVAILGGLRSSH